MQDSSAEMNSADLDRRAWAGTETPPGLGYAETLYFLMVRALCQVGKARNLTKEDYRKEREKINNAVSAYRADMEMTRRAGKLLTATGAARAALRKAANAGDDSGMIEAAKRLTEALDNIPL